MRRHKRYLASVGLAVIFAASGVLAQTIGGLTQPRAYEINGQNPRDYAPEEALAVAVTVAHTRTTVDHDLAAHMALIDPDIISRGDPAQTIRQGARAYCGGFGFVRRVPSWYGLDEVYVVGGPLDALVVSKRIDVNGPAPNTIAAGASGFGGYQVEVATLLRVNPSTGLITEWYDAPVNRIGQLNNAAGGQASQEPNPNATFPAACMPFPLNRTGVTGPQPTPTLPPPADFLPYGTVKPQAYWNTEETLAGQAVRAWYAAWQAGNPLLLAAFVSTDVIYRTDPAADLVKGRDALLRSVCGIIGGELELRELYPIGADWSTMVLTEVIRRDANGQPMRVAGFFRVQRGLIVEWMDSVVEATGPAAAANPDSAACQTVNGVLPAPPGAAA